MIFRYLHFVYSNYKKTLIPIAKGRFFHTGSEAGSIFRFDVKLENKRRERGNLGGDGRHGGTRAGTVVAGAVHAVVVTAVVAAVIAAVVTAVVSAAAVVAIGVIEVVEIIEVARRITARPRSGRTRRAALARRTVGVGRRGDELRPLAELEVGVTITRSMRGSRRSKPTP